MACAEASGGSSPGAPGRLNWALDCSAMSSAAAADAGTDAPKSSWPGRQREVQGK